MNVADGYIRGLARGNAQVANEWQQHAQQLQEQLASATANLEAMRALKDIAIAELAKLDPGHFLTVQANRQEIINTAYAASRKSNL